MTHFIEYRLTSDGPWQETPPMTLADAQAGAQTMCDDPEVDYADVIVQERSNPFNPEEP